MKKAVEFSVLSLAVCSLTCSRAQPEAVSIDENEARALFDYSFKKELENFKYNLRCGFPNLGIPSLGPFYVESFELNKTVSLFSVEGGVRDFTLAGLDEYVVDNATVNMFSLSGSFGMSFPKLSLSSSYSIDATVLKYLPILFGHGRLGLDLNDISIAASGKISVSIGSGGLNLSSFNVDVSVGSVNSDTSGIYDSTIVSNLFNTACRKTLEFIFDINKLNLQTYLEDTVTSSANEYLRKLSWSDMMSGFGGGEGPHLDPQTGELICPLPNDAGFESDVSYNRDNHNHENFLTKLLRNSFYSLSDLFGNK